MVGYPRFAKAGHVSNGACETVLVIRLTGELWTLVAVAVARFFECRRRDWSIDLIMTANILHLTISFSTSEL